MDNLYEQTIRLIATSGANLNEIAAGAKVGRRWLDRMLAGDFKEPGVHKIQRVHDFLSVQKRQPTNHKLLPNNHSVIVDSLHEAT